MVVLAGFYIRVGIIALAFASMPFTVGYRVEIFRAGYVCCFGEPSE
jgi:hypothetical protein